MGRWPNRDAVVLAAAGSLFVVVTVIRFSAASVGDGYALLYVLPIAVMAVEFGLVAGVLAATLAMILVVAWAQLGDVGLTLAGYLTRAVTFFLLGGLVGFEIQRHRRLEAEHEQLLARMDALAHTDDLTGLRNRRAWNEELRREMERARRSGTRLAVAMLDLDRFKEYNDRHGHPAGDELLKQAASAWRTRLRAVDCLARYGGEEFAVLLPGCPPGNPCDVIERLRRATPMDQTVSAGVAEWDGQESPDAVIARADEALYEAKRAGRDMCVAASPA